MDFFLIRLKDKDSDKKLAKAIGQVPGVLAINVHPEGNTFYNPHSLFLKEAKQTGIAALAVDRGLSMSYIPNGNYGGIKKHHIAVAIAQEYDSMATRSFWEKVEEEEEYIIPYRYTEKNFIKYNYKDTLFDCSDIQNKIVLMGYLGASDEDFLQTPLGFVNRDEYDPKLGGMYGIVIIANQVLGIIDGIELKEY